MTHALDWLAAIHFTEHARERIRDRFGPDVSLSCARGEIRSAILADRVFARGPDWQPAADDQSYRYVWDSTGTRCWVVAPTRRGLTVITLLLSRNERDHRAGVSHLRSGLGYA